MKSIAVCIVNYNTRDLLHDCLVSVLREEPSEVIVVDNASMDGSAEMVADRFPAVRLIPLRKNVGYGAAANRSISTSGADHVLLLNSDTRLQPGALQALGDYLDAHSGAAMIGPKIVGVNGRLQTSSFRFPTPVHIFLYLSDLQALIRHIPVLRNHSLQARPDAPAAAVPWVLGAALAFRRCVFESIGGFDESFFMYFEEVDLCYRLSRQGWQIHFAPVTEVIHVGGASTEQFRTEMNAYYFASLARFYRKHYSPLRLAALTLMINWFALMNWPAARPKPSV